MWVATQPLIVFENRSEFMYIQFALYCFFPSSEAVKTVRIHFLVFLHRFCLCFELEKENNNNSHFSCLGIQTYY